MRFEAIGDMPAPSYFDINEETGAISVKADLKTDDEIEYKVCVVNFCPRDRGPKVLHYVYR